MMVHSLLPEWSERSHPVIGMLHAPPLPGSPRSAEPIEKIVNRVLQDAETLAAGGVDGLMLENFGDVPFFPQRVPPITVACLTRLAVEVCRAVPLPLGINCLRNDAQGALAVALASGAKFIRVNVLSGARLTDQGVVSGPAAELLRERAAWSANHVAILADVAVKHSSPLAPRSLADETRELVERSGADAVIVTGSATGAAVDTAELEIVSRAAAGHRVFVGSGATADNVTRWRKWCHGFIVGTAFKPGGRIDQPVELERVRRFVHAVQND
jgi:uncharacterized protein